MPLILSKKTSTKSLIQPREKLPFNEYLGRSYVDRTLPIGSSENVAFPVIDIKKLYQEHPNYITDARIGKGEATSFSYANFERYTSNSKTSKKIKLGFSINLGLFSIGAKRSMTEIYSSSLIQESNRVYGELNVEIKDSYYILQTSSNINKIITLDYLTPEFKDELYNTHPSELFNSYGGFVLTDFITGGRTTAVFTGSYSGFDAAETKEKSMDTDISASYGFQPIIANGKISGEFGIGKAYAQGSSTSNKISVLQTSIKTLGGSLAFSNFSAAKSINDINIDLSSWLNSLNDKSTHSIIDIADEGLVPLTGFVMEENFKKYFNSFYEKGVSEIKALQEPYIAIIQHGSSSQSIIYSMLVTRFGDGILLDTLHLSYSQKDIENTINSIKEEKLKIYDGLKIKYFHDNAQLIITPPLHNYSIEEYKMKKYIDTKHNMIYLIYINPNNKYDPKGKYALSIHADYLIDTYALRKFVNALPAVEMRPEELFNYSIVAL